MKMTHRPRTSSLFLLELIFSILFFSVASAICIQIFVRAHTLSRDARALHTAVSACSDAAEIGSNAGTAADAAEKLAAEGISARVIDMHTIKPLDTELVLKAAKETGAIVTTEEANVLGGLGAAVAEYLGETYPIPVVRHGVNDEFGRSGKAPLVLDAYGINADGIAAKAKQAIAMKK